MIQGGGQDLSRQDGQVRKAQEEQQRKSFDLNSAKAALEREEGRRLQALKARIEATIDANPLLKKYKNQLLLDITSEGLRIQIVDEQNRPMFALANANLQPYTKEILHAIGFVLNEVPNRVGLSGHTDSTPYMSDAGYSNWELSADRANASRRELVIGGMKEEKVLRVVGLGSAANLDKLDPFNPINRRISIIVMNKRMKKTSCATVRRSNCRSTTLPPQSARRWRRALLLRRLPPARQRQRIRCTWLASASCSKTMRSL